MSDVVDRVFVRLGFAAKPKPDKAGLDALYAAWCGNVPFDNLRKRIALASGKPDPLPGGLPEDFLAAYLEHGTSGTCWPSSNGLHALVAAAGFDVRRISASMFDRNDHNHGSLIVRLDGAEWLVDSSMLTSKLIRLQRGVASNDDDPVHPIRVEPVDDSFRIHWSPGRMLETVACRLMQDPVDEKFYLDRYEISRGYSVFNTALYARRSFPGKLVNLIGRTRFERTATGLTSRELEPAEIREALVGEFGYSPAIVASYEKTAGFA